MIEIGGQPILWHIMKIYSAHGINDFVICLGYKGYVIKEYFANYFLHMSDVTFDLAQQPRWKCTSSNAEPWRVTLVDTGERHDDRRPAEARAPTTSSDDEAFCFTYGDGVADVDIARADRLPPARTASWPPSPPCSRPAASARSSSKATAVRGFVEKPRGDGGLDQRRLLRAVARVPRLHRRRRHALGSASRWSGLAADGQLTAFRASRLLAADGHAARQEPPRGAVGSRARRPGRCGHELRRFWRGKQRPPDRPHRLQGRLAGAVAAARWARRSTAMPWRRRP